MKSEVWRGGCFIDNNGVLRHHEEVEAELLAETSVEARSAVDVNTPSFGQAGITVERRLWWPWNTERAVRGERATWQEGSGKDQQNYEGYHWPQGWKRGNTKKLWKITTKLNVAIIFYFLLSECSPIISCKLSWNNALSFVVCVEPASVGLSLALQGIQFYTLNQLETLRWQARARAILWSDKMCLNCLNCVSMRFAWDWVLSKSVITCSDLTTGSWEREL